MDNGQHNQVNLIEIGLNQFDWLINFDSPEILKCLRI